MKNKVYLLLNILAVFLFLSSCGKKVQEVNSEFIGVWTGDKDNIAYTIRIDKEGQGRYSYVGDGKMGNSEGRVRYRNGNLKFGTLSSLKVNSYPELKDDFWVMKVDEVEYFKVP